MHPETWARTGHPVLALDGTNLDRQTDRRTEEGMTQTAILSSQCKSPEYGETQMLRHMNFRHCIPRLWMNSNISESFSHYFSAQVNIDITSGHINSIVAIWDIFGNRPHNWPLFFLREH